MMSTLDPSLQAALFPSISSQQSYQPGVFSPQQLLSSVSVSNSSRMSRLTMTNNRTPPPNRRSASPTFILAQHPAKSYRRLGMPRSEMFQLPDFMRIDLNGSQNSSVSVDSLAERMKLFDLFMTNFASQFNGTSHLKSPPASRSIISQSPEMRRSYTDVEDLIESKPILPNVQSPQPSNPAVDGINSEIAGSQLEERQMKRCQTPTIASRGKRQNKSTRAVKRQERPGSYIRSKTFDASLLENELMSSSPQLAAAIVTLTKRESSVPLTFSGDVRAPAPPLFPRDVPELWSTVNSKDRRSPSANNNKAASKAMHASMNSSPTGCYYPLIQQENKVVPVESVNVANIKRLLQANKINVSAPPEHHPKITNVVAAAVANRNTLARSRSMSPAVRNAAGRRITSPPKSPTGNRPQVRHPSPSRSHSKSPAKAEVIDLCHQSSRENTISIRESMCSQQSDNNNERVQSSKKSTKSVHFHLVEDVRFYNPWSNTTPLEPTTAGVSFSCDGKMAKEGSVEEAHKETTSLS